MMQNDNVDFSALTPEEVIERLAQILADFSLSTENDLSRASLRKKAKYYYDKVSEWQSVHSSTAENTK